MLGLDTKVGSEAAASAPRSASGRSRPKTLHRGMTGAWVAELQRKLVARGYLTLRAMATGPGVFGPRTEQAVMGLQVDMGLPETGMVGARTWAALNGDYFSPVQRASRERQVTSSRS